MNLLTQQSPNHVCHKISDKIAELKIQAIEDWRTSIP